MIETMFFLKAVSDHSSSAWVSEMFGPLGRGCPRGTVGRNSGGPVLAHRSMPCPVLATTMFRAVMCGMQGTIKYSKLSWL